jgi:hypothetical protein
MKRETEDKIEQIICIILFIVAICILVFKVAPQ